MSSLAVFESGGKQHRVSVGDVLAVDLLEADAGKKVTFEKVLLLVKEDGDTLIGKPVVEGCTIEAEVLQHVQDEKIRIIKNRRRKHSRTTMGHRQRYTELKITRIK